MIAEPADSTRISHGTVVTFSTGASDSNEGLPSGDALVWTSDLDGPLGTGTPLELGNLSVGVHQITLVATDFEEVQHMSSISLIVDPSGCSGIGLALLPTDWKLPVDYSVQFAAEADSTRIAWAVDGWTGGNPTVGTITPTGLYTAPDQVPAGGTVDVQAVVADNTACVSSAVSVRNSATTPAFVWSSMTPRVTATTQSDPTLFEVEVAGDASLVELETPSGDLPLQAQRTGRYGIALEATDLLQGYRDGDLHTFAGFLKVYDGGVQLPRRNIIVNVADPTVESIPVSSLDSDAQVAAHVINLRFDDLILGESIPHALIQRLYGYLPDAFDFIAVVEQVDAPRNRTYRGVSNDVSGIGVPIYDQSGNYGSTGQLQGIIDYPISTFFDLGETAANHEIGHRWINFLDGALSEGRPHWPLSDLARGLMGFSLDGGAGGSFPFELVAVGSGVYELQCANVTREFTDLDLYLMGLLPADSVGSHVVLDDQSIFRTCGVQGTGFRVGIDDVIASNGIRSPSYQSAPRDFRLVTLVLSRGRLLSNEEMAFFNHMAKRGESRSELWFTSGLAEGTTKPFFLATGGRATLSTRVWP